MHVTDRTNASRTMLYNIRTLDWDDALLKALSRAAQKAATNLGMNVIVLDINQGAWKLETERGVIMDGDKPEHLLEAIPVMGCYCDIIGVRSFARFENKEDDYNEVIINQFIQHFRGKFKLYK